MIEDFISRSLILAFGYAYPAFQCFKTLEKNKVGIPELRFWCQYWTIVAVLTVLEKFLDIFISWLPFYRGIKLAIFIYLWHPSTKGSSYIYETLLQPYFARHETDIDRRIAELKERVWNLVSSYWYNCADMSSKKVVQVFQLMLSQFMLSHYANNIPPPRPQPQVDETQQSNEAPTPTPPSTPSGIFKRNASDKQRPSPVSSPVHRGLTPKSESFNKTKLRNQAQSIQEDDIYSPDSSNGSSVLEEKSDNDPELLAARVKLRQIRSNKMV